MVVKIKIKINNAPKVRKPSCEHMDDNCRKIDLARISAKIDIQCKHDVTEFIYDLKNIHRTAFSEINNPRQCSG
jgi:adenylosuccinate lyase